jgi:hypothetical protein
VSAGVTTSFHGPAISLPLLSQPPMSVASASTMQPSAPAFCVRAPVVVSRLKIATAAETREAT